MMIYRSLVLTALLLLLSGRLSAQQAESAQHLKTCTLKGCISSATIRIQLSGGWLPKFSSRLKIDGAKVTCAIPVLPDHVPFGVVARCGNVAEINVQRESSGNVEVSLVIYGTPTRITVSLVSSAETVAERVFLPAYEDNSPNGPDCESHCKFWRTTWRI